MRTAVQVAIAIIYCLFAAGIVFGYAAIKPVLIQEGVYSQFCERDEVMIGELGRTCYEQEIRWACCYWEAYGSC